MVKCPCGFGVEDIKDLIWTELNYRWVLLCFKCASIIHANHIAEGVE